MSEDKKEAIFVKVTPDKMSYTKLFADVKPLDIEGINPPSEMPPIQWIDVTPEDYEKLFVEIEGHQVPWNKMWISDK